MKSVSFAPNFSAWRKLARAALAEDLPPEKITWEESDERQQSLFNSRSAANASSTVVAAAPRVPCEFFQIAERVACHRSSMRWGLLYRVVWRLTHGEPHLLRIAVDPDIHRLTEMDKAVRRDVHKMRAFVRFREVPEQDWFVAWFEPQHFIVELNAPFFRDRFAQMRWSILTPDRCAHWDRERLSFTPGVSREHAPAEDQTEELWRTYYAHIFNPARIKLGAMRAEMPQYYWRNLPEADVIDSLVREAPPRVESMIDASAKKLRPDEYGIATPPATESLQKLRAAARHCEACPLYKNATQTVFGEGAENARVVLLGEQPGDQEDRAGHPFIGPAGQLLDRALAEAGLKREDCYVTNVVKHFKWEPRGKRRLHAKPGSRDIAACRPWAEAELHIIQPCTLVCLGSTAAQFVFGKTARVERDRGKVVRTEFAPRTLITVHPSALLRQPDPSRRESDFAHFVADLRLAAKA